MPANLSLLDFELSSQTRRETVKPRTALQREKNKKGAAAKTVATGNLRASSPPYR